MDTIRRSGRATTRILGLALGCLLTLGCSGARGGGGNSPTGGGPDGDGHGGAGGPSVNGTVGALDEAAVKKEAGTATKKAEACVEKARELLPYVEGAMTISLKVDRSGKVIEAYLVDNDFGFDKTESCILEAFEAGSWPKPVGGDVGEISQSLAFESGAAEPPQDWPEAELKAAMVEEEAEGFDTLMKKLGACRAEAKAGPMKATIYIDEDGLVQAVGTSVADAAGKAATPCVVTQVQTTSFPAPDGLSKATVTVP